MENAMLTHLKHERKTNIIYIKGKQLEVFRYKTI